MKRRDRVVFALYADQVVSMAYVPDASMRFNLACLRVTDNAPAGHVVSDGEVFAVTRGKRTAVRLHGEEKAAVLAKVPS